MTKIRKIEYSKGDRVEVVRYEGDNFPKMGYITHVSKIYKSIWVKLDDGGFEKSFPPLITLI